MACHTTYCVAMKPPALRQAVQQNQTSVLGPEKGQDQTQVRFGWQGLSQMSGCDYPFRQRHIAEHDTRLL